MRPSGLSWVWLVIWITFLVLTAVQVSGRRSALRRRGHGRLVVPLVQAEPKDSHYPTRVTLRGRIRPVLKHSTRSDVTVRTDPGAESRQATTRRRTTTARGLPPTPEARTEAPASSASSGRLRFGRSRTRTRNRSRTTVTPSANIVQVVPGSKSTSPQITTSEKEVSGSRIAALATKLRRRVEPVGKSLANNDVTTTGDRVTGRRSTSVRRLRGRARGSQREDTAKPVTETPEAASTAATTTATTTTGGSEPRVEKANADWPVTVVPLANPRRVKLARSRTIRRRPTRPMSESVAPRQMTERDDTPTPTSTIKGLRTHRVDKATIRLLPGRGRSGVEAARNETGPIQSVGDKLRKKLARRPEPRRRIRLTTPSLETTSGTEATTERIGLGLGRRRHRTGERKRIKIKTTTPSTTTTAATTTTTVWPPSVAYPTQGPGMGGNPFDGILSKSDLFKMGRNLHPDWWNDPTVGECPGEHLIVHHSLYFHCARRNHNDLSDPYGKCIHGDSACKQDNPLSKCCYNGCGDICLKPEKLIHEFCYEAMGSIRYQPGEEFMHGEWWCKCDPKKKSYQEMCTRLKCTLEDLVDDHELKEKNEEEEESSEEGESEEESSEEEDTDEESSEEEGNEEESEEEEEKSKSKKRPKCKKGSKGCGKGKGRPKCKKGWGKCKKRPGGGKPKGKGRKCKKGDKKCKKPHPGNGTPSKGKKCKKGDANCNKPPSGRPKWTKQCKKGKGKCKRPHHPIRKCKKGKCRWHKKPKPIRKWKRGGHGNGGWKKHKTTNVKKHKFSFKKHWKGKWKTRKWGRSWKRSWKKKWVKRRWNKWKPHKRWRPRKHRWGYRKQMWRKRSWRKRSWRKRSWRNKKHGNWKLKWHKRTKYRVVTKKWKVKWTLGKGSCEQIWVMGCNGLTLNEKLALDLILAIRQSHYEWPEDFVSSANGSAELSNMLKTAYLDNYYYGGFNDSLNWLFWVSGLRRACNTSVGDGVYPVTWSTSLRKWQEATERELRNVTGGDDLTYAKNWTTLWFDPLRDTCRRNVWFHYTERHPQKNVGEFELTWHSGKTIELCTTNLELGWLMRFVPMYRRYVWTLILLGSKEGWHGPPQYKILGVYWKYGARRYDYVLRSCYNIWSWGCNGTGVNETWAREWVKYSSQNGFTWIDDFMRVGADSDVDGFLRRYGLEWDGLSVLNGTDSEKLDWALWYDAYNAVCNATVDDRSEEKLVDVLQEWKANKETEFASSTNITINGNWSDLWRYVFRHSCITKLKIYRRFAYDLIVHKERHSMIGYWMQKYTKGDWNTAFFQKVKKWTVKELSWESSSYLDLSFFDGYGSCIDRWKPGCNTTLTNSSYLDLWRDLMDRAGFEWSGNFTLRTNDSFVQELADKYLADKNVTDASDYNWAFWFDGWQAMCNGSADVEDGAANWTTILHRWALDWTERLGDDRAAAVDWMKLWVEPLLYMCNYTGQNDTIGEDFERLLTMTSEEGARHAAGIALARAVRYEKIIERRLETIRKWSGRSRYQFNHGLCIDVWTSACDGRGGLNATQVDGLLQCLQRSTPTLRFMNYTGDEVKQLLSTASMMDLDDDERQLLEALKNGTIPDVNQLVWKLWVGSWKSVCSRNETSGITLDEVLAALEEDFEENQILQLGGTVDEWKKAWIQPWVGPCKGDSFSCEYKEEYEEAGPMTWNYECSVYLNETIKSFNWTSDGNDWKDKCGFEAGAKFDWTNIEEVMKVWTDLCNAGTSAGMLPYTEDKWDEDFDIACHKLKIFKIDDGNGGK